MAKLVLNKANSIVDPASVYPQAQMDQVVFDILSGAAGGQNGTVSGCAVTAQGSPDNTVAVASGSVVVNGSLVSVASGNVTMTAAHATNPRKDMITVNSSGTKAYTAGTAAAAPVWPAIPANSVVLAWIYVAANDNTINSNQIVDCRIFVPSPITGGALWTTVSKDADEAITSDTSMNVDSDLVFTMASSTKYRIRMTVFASAVGNSGFKYGWTGPASPTLVLVRSDSMRDPDADSTARFDAAYETTGINLGLNANSGVLKFDIIIHNGSNGGDFQFTWSQNSSVGTATTVRAGSYLEYSEA